MIPSGPITGHAIRLKPGDDLVSSIEDAAKVAMVKDGTGSAFILTAVGSLDTVTLRMANACRTTNTSSSSSSDKNNNNKNNNNNNSNNDIKEFQQRMEVISLVGTMSLDSGKHLHMSLSDKDGNVIGGHLISGRVFTTLELVIGTISNVTFQRSMDEATGYRELEVLNTSPVASTSVATAVKEEKERKK